MYIECTLTLRLLCVCFVSASSSSFSSSSSSSSSSPPPPPPLFILFLLLLLLPPPFLLLLLFLLLLILGLTRMSYPTDPGSVSPLWYLNKTQVTRTTHEPPHNRTHERNTRPNHLAAIGGCATTVRATSHARVGEALGFNPILPFLILYGMYCNKGGSGGNTILRNSVGDNGVGGLHGEYEY